MCTALRHCFGADANFNHVAMKSVTKRNSRKSQREAARLKRQGVPGPMLDDEEMEVHFNQTMDTPDSPPASPPHSPTNQGETTQGETDYAVVLDMVQNLRDKLSALNLDNENIRAACDALRRQCQDQGVAFGDLSKLVKQSLEGRQSQQPREETGRPHPLIRPDLIDSRGNLHATDIGITWQGSDTFLHGVRVAGPEEDTRHRPATSTPYPPVREHPSCGMSTPRPPRPVCMEIPETPTHRTGQEGRPSHRPAAPMQRFNKSIGWPAWFRHFKTVTDVHGWDKDQRALQMVSYLDEKAMNVAQELSDRELYDYDVLIKLLGDRFDPASRVSASRSRFHGRTRRHQEDADTYADSITELCRLGYPQSSPELRQELISEQFVRGQSDPELKKYLWVVIRTQKDKKASNPNRGVHRFRQPQPYSECSPPGGTSIRVGGRRRPGGGYVRRGGPTAAEHTEGGGTTSVSGVATDVYPRASHGLRDATDCAVLSPSTDARSLDISESWVPRTIPTWS